MDGIIAACTHQNKKICLFSATILPVVEELARTVQRDPIHISIGQKYQTLITLFLIVTRNTPTETIDQQLLFVGSEQGKLLALRRLIQEGKVHPPVLIFVQSKQRAQQLFHELIYDGINVDVIHADRTPSQRNATVDKFRSGDIWLLITTELMGRGMDFKGVNLVINYDFPTSITSYIHRIGRTGRAGRPGQAITFYTEGDYVMLRSIANVMRQSGCKNIPDWIFASLATPRWT